MEKYSGQLNISSLEMDQKKDICVSLRNLLYHLNPLTTSVPHNIETSQLFCNANDFFMMGNTGR